MHMMTLRRRSTGSGSDSFKIVICGSKSYLIPLNSMRCKNEIRRQFPGIVDHDFALEAQGSVITMTPDLIRFRLSYPEAFKTLCNYYVFNVKPEDLCKLHEVVDETRTEILSILGELNKSRQ